VPSREEHLQQAARSAELAALLDANGAFPDWALVATAYQAVHLVEAYFAARGEHHQTHAGRNRAVGAALLAIAFAYASLQNLSRSARYEAAGTLTRLDYELAAVRFALIEAELRSRL
jgi:hypothetical protein